MLCNLILCILGINCVYADCELIQTFPLDNYNQQVAQWIKPTSRGYDVPVMSSAQQTALVEAFRDQFYTPWTYDYIKKVLSNESGQGDLYLT